MRWLTGSALAVCLLLGLASSAVAAALRAERITESNARRLIIGGPDAIGGVGDWYLANDVVEVIVDDPGRRYATLNHGGTIVDAGLRDRTGEDQFARLFPLLNMDLRVFLNYDTIEATLDEAGGWARLVVSSSRGVTSLPRGNALARSLNPLVPEPEALRGVFVETEYAVFPGEPFVRVTTTIRNESNQPAPIFSYGEVWMRGGRSTRSWVGNTLVPAKSAGFHHVSFDRHNILAARDAFAAFTFVSVPGMRQFPPIAYAVFSPERVARNLLVLGIAWKIQEQAYGGLGAATKRRLADLAKTREQDGDLARSRVARLKPGAKLIREWQGETHTVAVLEDGFEWRGKRWRSLSVIAREITGVHWSGPRFFGLNGKAGQQTDARAEEAADA